MRYSSEILIYLGALQHFSFLSRKAGSDDVIGFADKFANLIVRNILVEVDADPIFLIHMPTGSDACVAGL